MEMNNIKSVKHEDNTDLKSEHSNNEREREEAIDSIFYNPRDDNKDAFFARAGEIGSQSDNNTKNAVEETRNNFDMRSEFGGPLSESLPDVNIYQHKKTVAQGMMDIALFSANANQLRYVLDSNNHPFFYPGVLLIAVSLILQVAVGVGLLLNSRYNVKSEKEICIANKINNFTVVGIFLITVINVFISAFGVATSSSSTTFIAPVSISPRFGNYSNTTSLNESIFNITTIGNFTDTDSFIGIANFTD